MDVSTHYSDPDMKFKLHLSYPSTNLHLHSPALTGAAGSQLPPRSCGLRKREERKGLIQNKVWGYAVLDLDERVDGNAPTQQLCEWPGCLAASSGMWS